VQTPEISGCLDGRFLATGFEYLELAKVAQDSSECLLAFDTLKYLAENYVRGSEALPIELAVKVIGFGVSHAA